MDEQRVADDAYRFLRRHTRGDLRFEEHFRPLRYVIAPEGQLVAPVMYAMLDAVDTVLFVPEFAEAAMEVQTTLSGLDPDGPRGGLTDRWRIYHGDPEDSSWALLDIDAVRFERHVVDGEALMRANPLAEVEARLCRQVNQGGGGDLRAICRHHAGADVEEPKLVGIDALGFDVRRRFDVVRVEAPGLMESAADVQRTLQQMIREAAGSPG